MQSSLKTAEPPTMLYLSGIVITFFLLLLLIWKREKTTADKILACWLALIGVHLLLFYLFISGNIYSYPWLLGIHFPMPLMHGPFLYLYALSLTGKHISNKTYLLHFLPALLCYAYLAHFFLLPPEQKIFIFQNKGIGYEVFQTLLISAIIISGIAYVILTTLLHRTHRRNILNQFSNIEKINLDWIQYLMYGIAVIWAFVIFGNDNLIFGAVVFYVLFMGFFGIRQVGIFTPGKNPQTSDIENPLSELPEQINGNSNDFVASKDAVEDIQNQILDIISSSTLETVHDDTKSTKKKYSRSGLSDEAAEQLHQKLNQIIHTEKIFCESSLTLTQLAKKLGTHPNYLSQVINEKEGKNFYDYINTLRTEEFIRLLTNPGNQKFTLLSVAFECGFNSKSSFNKYFRKVTGQSPSEYLQELNIKAVA